MPKTDDVVAGELIESAWANQDIRDRTVQRATTAGDLAGSWPAPQDGETVWQQDTDQLWIFNGTVWVEYGTRSEATSRILRSGDAMTGTLHAVTGDNGWRALDTAILTSDYVSAPPSTFGYTKTPGGIVHLTGKINNVDQGTIGEVTVGTLPVGVRPPETYNYTLHNLYEGEGIRFTIGETGVMAFPNGGPGNWFSLDNVAFWAGWA